MILSRVRIIPQERYDLEDLLAQLSSIRTDSKFYTKEFVTAGNYILKGFAVSGIGLKTATIDVNRGTLVNSLSTSDFSWFVVDPSTTSITVPDADLEDGQRNYLELELFTESSTPVTKAFWDPAASGGAGAEFNQEIDTMVDTQVRVVASTGGFSGNPNRIKLAIVDVDISGNITGILDKRDLFFRLGLGNNPENEFTYATRTEPEILFTLSGVTGTFVDDEEVTLSSGVTAKVLEGGAGATIKVQLPSSDSYAAGNTILGGTSGATGTLDSFAESFSGADKDIKDQKSMLDAMMTEIRDIKGTDFWYEKSGVSLNGAFAQTGLAILSGLTSDARFSWTGSEFSISDAEMTPGDTDNVGSLRIFDRLNDYTLTRQDGQGGSSSISVADGEVVWIQIPKTGNVAYSGVGTAAGNYRVTPRGEVPLDDTTYWLAYREGTRLYLRGLGELEAGETQQISDTMGDSLLKYLGFNPETATSVPYTQFPSAGLGNSFNDQTPVVEALSANTGNINQLQDILSGNVYDESINYLTVPVSGESLPVPAGTTITLPNDTRDSNTAKQYVVGSAVLEMRLNTKLLVRGVDYNEVGTAGALSSTIEILKDIENCDCLNFRIDTVGGFVITNTAVGVMSLQDAYNAGRVIATTTNQPVQITGPASENILRVLGNIESTGRLVSQSLEMERTGANPIAAAKDGLYVDAAGNLIYTRQNTSFNISNVLEGKSTSMAIKTQLINNSGATIQPITPIRLNAVGQLALIDPSNQDQVFDGIGLTSASIANGTSGDVVTDGRIENVTTAYNVGSTLYVSKIGILTDQKPTIGTNGFVSGDYIVVAAKVVANIDTPANKDVIVNYKIIGTL